MNAVANLKNAMNIAQKKLVLLRVQRDKLTAQIDALEGKKIVKKTTKKVVKITKNKAQKRVKNDISLAHVIENLLSDGSSRSVTDIVKAVQNSDYKSNSKSLYSCVATVLVTGNFEKVSRGIYQIKQTPIMTDVSEVSVIVATPDEPVVETVEASEPIKAVENLPIEANEPQTV